MRLKSLFAAAFLFAAGSATADINSIVTFPGSTNGAVQFNRNGTFAGDVTGFSYSTNTKTLNITQIRVSTLTINGLTYTWPQTQGGGLFLRNDGAGGLTWETPSTFSISSGVALGVLDGSVYISTPATSDISFNANQFIVSLQGATTAAVRLDGSSVTLMGVLTAQSPVIVTGSQFSLDKSSVTLLGPNPSVGGDLTGTLANAQVSDDSHNHTGATISNLDISADTNLTVSAPVTLTNDTVGIDKSSATLLGPTIDSNELPANGYDGTYVKVSGDAMTGQLTVRGSSLTVTGGNGIRSNYNISAGSLTIRNLASTVLAVDANGLVISTTVSSGAGSAASALAISTSSVIVSSPTPQLDFNGSQVTASVSGGTTTITLSPSSVTLYGANVVRLSPPSQQTGSVWVTSGTVSGAMVIGTMTVNGTASVADQLTVTGGIVANDLTANNFVITDGSKRLRSMALTPLPEGSSNYVQINPASPQSGAFNISSGTLNGPFYVNITTAPPGTARTMHMNSSFAVETSTSFPGDIAYTKWNVVIPTASFQSIFYINASTTTDPVNYQTYLAFIPESGQVSLNAGQSVITAAYNQTVMQFGSTNKFAVSDIPYALTVDSFVVMGPGSSGSALGLRGGPNGADWFSLYASTNMTQNTRYTVPNSYPSGTQALCSDSSGNMSFGCVTGGGGGGGSSPLETMVNGVRISSPTPSLNFKGHFTGSVPAGATTQILVDTSDTWTFTGSSTTIATLLASSAAIRGPLEISQPQTTTSPPLVIRDRHNASGQLAQSIYAEYTHAIIGTNGEHYTPVYGLFISTPTASDVLSDGSGLTGVAIESTGTANGVISGGLFLVSAQGKAPGYFGNYIYLKYASDNTDSTSTLAGIWVDPAITYLNESTARSISGKVVGIGIGPISGSGGTNDTWALYSLMNKPSLFVGSVTVQDAGGYNGVGTNLTGLNGSNINTGQVSTTVLPSTISFTTKNETRTGIETLTSSFTVTSPSGSRFVYNVTAGSGTFQTLTVSASSLAVNGVYMVWPASGSIGNYLRYVSSNVLSWDAAAGGTGAGTVNSGTAQQVAYYAANGTAVSGATNFTTDGSSITASTGVFTSVQVTTLTMTGDGNPSFIKGNGDTNTYQIVGSSAACSAGQWAVFSTSDTVVCAAAPSAGSGDITDVIAGTGLSGGAASGAATLNVVSTNAYQTSVNTFTSSQTINSSLFISTSVDASGQGIVFDSPLKSAYSITTTSNAVISAGFFSCTNNDTAALFAGQSGHIPCVFSLFQDQTTSNNIGYGLEGRTNATGQASEYAGALALGTHNGAYTGTLSGMIVRTEMYASDGSTPLSTGTMRQLWIKDPVGSGLDAGRTHSLFNESTKPSYSSASFIIGGDTVPISDNVLYTNGRNQTGTLPSVVHRSGVSGRYFWMGLGHTSTLASIVVPASNNAFMTGTQSGDLGLRADGSTNKVVVGAGSGQGTLYVNQSSATVNGSLTVTASSLAVNGVYMVWPSSAAIGKYLRYVSSNVLSWDGAGGGGSTSPGGSPWNVQVSSNGNFEGVTGFNVNPSSIVISNAYETYVSTLNVTSSMTVIGVDRQTFSNASIVLATRTVSRNLDEGEIYGGSTQQAMVNKVSGATQTLVGTIFTLTASSANFNSANAVDMLGAGVNGDGVSTTGLTLPANFWTVGKSLNIVMVGTFTTTSTPAFVSSVTVGGSVIVSTNNFNHLATAGQSYWELRATLTCRSVGASGSIYGTGFMRFQNSRGTITQSTLLHQGNTVNTTATNKIQLFTKWGTANTSNNVTANNITITVLN